MEKPGWTPIVLRGAVPREAGDLLAIVIMGLASFQTSFVKVSLPVIGQVPWLALLSIPPACALASLSDTSRRLREELALFAYGGSEWQIGLRYFLRGAVCTMLAVLPVLLVEYQFSTSLLRGQITPLAGVAITGGISYALPSLRRTRSRNFAEHYKG